MEEPNEILAAIRALDQKFEARFTSIDDQFVQLRREFSEQLDGVSDGLHLEIRAARDLLLTKYKEARAVDEALDTKIQLVGENVANVSRQIRHYHHTFEAPLEARVAKLEAKVWADQTKKDEIAAESRRGS